MSDDDLSELVLWDSLEQVSKLKTWELILLLVLEYGCIALLFLLPFLCNGGI